MNSTLGTRIEKDRHARRASGREGGEHVFRCEEVPQGVAIGVQRAGLLNDRMPILGERPQTDVVFDAKVDVLIQLVGEHDAEDRGPLRVDDDMTQVDALRIKHGERLRAIAVGSQLSKRRNGEVEPPRRDEDIAGAAGFEKDPFCPTMIVGQQRQSLHRHDQIGNEIAEHDEVMAH